MKKYEQQVETAVTAYREKELMLEGTLQVGVLNYYFI